MKILVISDIHSCVDALNAVWAEEKTADAILCAGDIVDWGFHPHECIAWLKAHGAICVRGNHDVSMLELYDAEKREPLGEETTIWFHNLNRLTEEDIAWLRALPETAITELDGITYCMRHTHDMTTGEFAVLPNLSKHTTTASFGELWSTHVDHIPPERRLLFGHSHLCYALRAAPHEMYLNPGSLSYRLGPNAIIPGSDYMVIQDGNPILKHVDFPTKHLRRMLAESNFEDWIKQTAQYHVASAVD